MKAARFAILGLALAAGGAAALLAGRSTESEQTLPVPVAAPVAMAQVLVAAVDLAIGMPLTADDLRFQDWPAEAVNPAYITKAASPNAIQDWTGAIARAPFVAGEPIRPQKLIKGSGSGYLSAILPSGMRAVATKIGVDTAAGGFILPNDHVDVILTRRATEQQVTDAWSSSTILRNIPVLAIDQTVEEQNGQKVITGSTATLELSQQQAEVMAASREIGSLTLSLRSLADSAPNTVLEPETPAATPSGGLSVVRYGVTTSVVDR